DDCPSAQAIYYDMSEYTGGFAYNLKPEEIASSRVASLLSDPYRADIMRLRNSVSKNSPKSYEFFADSTAKKLWVIVNMSSGNLKKVSLFDPDAIEIVRSGEGVTVSRLSSLTSYEIERPKIGLWKAVIEGDGEFAIIASASSPLSFDNFDFVEYDDSVHSGYFKIVGYPIAGSKTAAKATLSGEASDLRFELKTSAGETFKSFKMDGFGKYRGLKVFLAEDFIAPDRDFYAYAFGKDENGVNFQRITQKPIVVASASISALSISDLSLGKETIYAFRITNKGKDDTFGITAMDDNHYIRSISREKVFIKSGDSADINITLNSGKTAAIGTRNELKVIAAPICGGGIGGYTQVSGSVTKAE
ncbi:MAG: hypothetical protein LBC09_02720, partial [Helicobacteraceae bacterium]|nr:hypothetical protein [Helicobacteraceae bacterium]